MGNINQISLKHLDWLILLFSQYREEFTCILCDRACNKVSDTIVEPHSLCIKGSHKHILLCEADTANIIIQIKSSLRFYIFFKLKGSFRYLGKFRLVSLSRQRLQTVALGLEAHFLLI